VEKKEFLNKILSSRSELECVLSQFSPNMMESQGMVDKWSIKEIIGHVGWYEEEMVNVLSTKVFKGSELWELELQERNVEILKTFRGKSLDEVIKTEKENYQKMIDLLQTLEEKDLNDPGAFAEMPSDWQPWSVIASNTYEHYNDHIEDLNRITAD
jgi:hypothetical protein